MASLSIVKLGDNTYQWTISGLSAQFNNSNYIEAGITSTSFVNGSATIGTKISVLTATSGTSFSASGTFSILTNGTYTFYGFTRALNYFYYTADSFTITHTNPGTTRPSNFSWVHPKIGTLILIGNSEWNNFRARVNQFRAYKGLTAYSFSNVNENDYFTPSSFRACANAIHDMTNNIPSTHRNVSDYAIQYPSWFTDLSTALNNIT